MEDLKEYRTLLIKEQYYLEKLQYFSNNNSNKLRKELMNLNLKELEFIENDIDKYKNKNKNKCHHLWVDDLIDLTPDASRYVTYCGNCFVTKNN